MTTPTDNTQPLNETIFSEGDQHFSALIHDINEAKQHIDLESYGFNKDPIGDRVAEALLAAAKRDVRIRILVDGVGSPLWSNQYANMLERAGIETKVFHPLPWQIRNLTRSTIRRPWLWRALLLFLKCNSRNHRKVCIIDQRIVYIGSFNIRQVHLSFEGGGSNWRDTSVRIEGIDCNDINDAFESAWHYQTIRERLRELFKQMRKEPLYRLNYTRHRRRIMYKHLLRKITRCQDRLWITNAYFLPDNFLLKRLRDAAKRGCDVRILLPRKSDVFMMPWASRTFYTSLIQSGVRIFEYLPTMLHAKSVILDDWMMVGSSNMNYRSLRHDLEADFTLRQESSKKTLVDLFKKDLQQAREITMDDWRKQQRWYKRLLGHAVLYAKYWF